MSRMPFRLVLLIGLVLATLSWAAGSVHIAHAATDTVGTCDESTLRSVINNAAPGDTVEFGCSGIITLTSGGGGPIILSKNLTIDGSESALASLSGGYTGPGTGVEVFVVNSGVSVTLNDLTISFGNGGFNGGGIENHGTLTVTNSVFFMNVSVNGGGIYNDGTLSVTSCNFSSNTASDSTTSSGGGIYNNGTATVSNSTFSGNSAVVGGGIENGSNGTLSVTNSSFGGNDGIGGGAITNWGTLTVTNNSFGANKSGESGGAILTESGTATISNSNFSENNAAVGGAVASDTGTLTISNSTINGNSASEYGGGIYVGGGTVTVTNSTFSGNAAGQGSGGGIENDGGNLSVSNSTFSGNSATIRGGGGIANAATATLTNDILANSPGGNCLTVSQLSFAVPPTDRGGNLADDASCGFTQASSTNSATGLNLGALANNGGPTPTIALGANSAAIDFASANCPATDQRGLPRPDAGETTCDAGAYESGAAETVQVASCDQTGLTNAVYNAGSGGTVQFGQDCTITLASTITLAQDVTIDGHGHQVTISGGHTAQAAGVQVFVVNSGATVTLNDLTIAHGDGLIGGGIQNSGILTVSNSTLSGNSAGVGGGIESSGNGTLTVSDSTFSGNGATVGVGGGISIQNSAALTVSDSTFSGNFSLFGASAIYNGGPLMVSNSTFSSNSSPAIAASSVTLSNSILAGPGGQCGNAATVTDRGGNLSTDASCGFTQNSSTNNATGLNLGALADNGGPTQTIALLPGSAAIGTGVLSACTAAPVSGLDQRGSPRPDPGDTTCDSGAYELQSTVLKSTPSVTVPAAQSVQYGSHLSFTVSATSPVAGAHITLTASGLPAGLTFMDNGDGTGTVSGTVTASVSGSPYTASFTANDGVSVGVGTGTVTITVTPAPLTLTADDQSMTYGGTAPPFTASSSDFVNGDTVASLTRLTCSSDTTGHAGTHPITCSGATDPNYTVTYKPGTLTISPAPLTITADNQSITYGGAVPALTWTASFVNNDTAVSLSTAPTCSTAPANSAAGSYDITCSGAADPDYTISYAKGTLTIEKKMITVTASSPPNQTYGSTSAPAVTCTATGFLGADTFTTPPDGAVYDATGTTPVTITATSDAGTYVTKCTGGDPGGNYTIGTSVPGSFTIKPEPLTITANDQHYTYGDAFTLSPNVSTSIPGAALAGTLACSAYAASDTAYANPLTVGGTSLNAGSYAIQCAGLDSGNYHITWAPGTLTVNQKAITVTASSPASQTYGSTIAPTVTCTATGFLGTDTFAAPPAGAVYDATGTTPVTITATSDAGTYVTKCSGGDAGGNYTIDTYVSGSFTIQKRTVGLTLQNTPALAQGKMETVAATVMGQAPLSGLTIQFALGSGPSTQHCAGTTDALGQASCTITVTQPLGPQPLAASFAGDANTNPVTATPSSTVVYVPLTAGGDAFVIGDQSAAASLATGTPVTFWSIHWSKSNSLSGGAAPPIFFGYAANVASPLVGSSFTSRMSDIAHTPASVPSYLEVLVASKISQAGGSVGGPIAHLDIVHVAPGYGPRPSQSGTGTIVLQIQ